MIFASSPEQPPFLYHHRFFAMTVSTKYVAPPKSSKSRNPNSSVQIQIGSKSQFEVAPRDTEEFEFVGSADFVGIAICLSLQTNGSHVTHE